MEAVDAPVLNDDQDLVKRAIGGDRSSFDELTRRHLQHCYRLARNFGLLPEDAADVVQDTFLAAYRALHGFNFEFKFATWLTRIHINKLLNHRRGLHRAKRIFWQPRKGGPIIEAVKTTSASTPEGDLERKELQQQLVAALKRLPVKQRMIFVLFEIENYKIHEIASLLKIPEGTVNSRLRHARLAMRERLREHL
ncbi:sigma-70 family RNA polymerase sigma factor [bacterium]|nr:sigma-70 family RNA polymerase sigma factor [bacterium]